VPGGCRERRHRFLGGNRAALSSVCFLGVLCSTSRTIAGCCLPDFSVLLCSLSTAIVCTGELSEGGPLGGTDAPAEKARARRELSVVSPAGGADFDGAAEPAEKAAARGDCVTRLCSALDVTSYNCFTCTTELLLEAELLMDAPVTWEEAAAVDRKDIIVDPVERHSGMYRVSARRRFSRVQSTTHEEVTT